MSSIESITGCLQSLGPVLVPSLLLMCLCSVPGMVELYIPMVGLDSCARDQSPGRLDSSLTWL